METEKETNANTIIATESGVEKKNETRLDDLPRLEDLLKSETDVKPVQELKGLKKVENNTIEENKTFKSKEDEKKTVVKRRVKLLTGVYIAVVALLLGFVGINIATLTMMNRDINNNANTIQSHSQQIDIYEGLSPDIGDPSSTIEVSVNPPRDYGDDDQELTFFDKMTILFRNIFG